eukprot:TRINITY_DN22004_c0_g3_i2.p1 TRINITY_DN22004_c0_g3~~TRINITY_DN22004_c0_g3_i2.p1  ORF type:complete len:436 (+),score=147.33 TRINITY_DN22004_c0_g3_i2:73-1308(+)
MEDYVRSALTASYARPGDDRPPAERHRELGFSFESGREVPAIELYCTAADVLPHVRALAAKADNGAGAAESRRVALAPAGAAARCLAECLRRLEPSWQSFPLPSDAEDASDLAALNEAAAGAGARVIGIAYGEAEARRLRRSLAAAAAGAGAAAAASLAGLELHDGSVEEEAKAEDLVLPAAVDGSTDQVQLKASVILGFLQEEERAGDDVVAFLCPTIAELRLGGCARITDALRQQQLAARQGGLGAMGAAEAMRKVGNELFGASLHEEAAAQYVNTRLYLEKVRTLTEAGGTGGGEVPADLLDAPRVQACRLACATNAAACHLQLGNLAECVNTCDDALAIDAKHVKALFRKASALRLQGDFAGAEAALRRALEVAPADAALRKDLAKVQELQRHGVEKEKMLAKRMFA